MNWEAAGAIGEIIGAIAVVASLVYLAVQIRIGARELRISARDSAFQALTDWNEIVMADVDLAWIFQIGSRNPSELNEAQRLRYGHVMYSFFKIFENIYIHHLEGSIDETVWSHNQAMLVIYSNQPGGRHYLANRKEIFDPRFLAFVAECTESTEPPAWRIWDVEKKVRENDSGRNTENA